MNICFTNKTRKEVNKYWMDKTKGEKIKIKKLHYDDNSQDMEVCVGMPIIARVNNKKQDIINNKCFTINSIDDVYIEVCNEFKTIKIEIEYFNRIFYLAFCITIHKSQGASFEDKYTIHEWGRLNKRLRYVSLSRATNENNVKIIL
jgi:ATP-dependent exoDNAse (exonuclease V) alpha subunit